MRIPEKSAKKQALFEFILVQITPIKLFHSFPMDRTSQFKLYFLQLSFPSVYLNDLLGMTSYPNQMFFPKLYPILLYSYIATGFSIQLMECAKVASYQNLSFCWTVPPFHKFHLYNFLVIIKMISYVRNSFLNFCRCVLLLSLI